jgi:hypothetical protein
VGRTSRRRAGGRLGVLWKQWQRGVAAVVDRGKEPPGDGTHPEERLCDLLV